MKPITRMVDNIFHLFKRWVGAKSIGVRALVFDPEGRVLLVRHTYRSGWHTPGGGVKPGETPVMALRREVWEEAGLHLRGEPQIFAAYLNKHKGLDDFPLIYVCENEQGDIFINDRAEIAEAGWFPVDALPPDITAKTRRRIEEFQGKIEVSHVW